MKKLMMGRVAGKPVYCDMDSFCASNSLVTGMTRSGKSYKMRTMAEALSPQIPVWIIDPEGEFYTLRERFPFLLFGEGGEAPIALNTARPIARNLLKWKQSAVLSLSALKEEDQHLWVSEFLNELMNRPREEWSRAVVMLDEAHLWAPNSGHGKTPALPEARNLARRGLKRGLVPVWATQRLSSLNVSVSASAENMLVGRTTRTADQEQAAKLMGVAPRNVGDFSSKMRRCHKGDFFAVGPAYGEEIFVLQTPPAHTTHFSGKIGQEPKVRATPVKLLYLVPEITAMVEAVKQEEIDKENDKQIIARLQQALKDGGIVEREVTSENETQLVAAKDIAETERAKAEERLNAMTEGISGVMHSAKELYEMIVKVRAGADGVPGEDASVPMGLSALELKMLSGLRECETIGVMEIPRLWITLIAGHRYHGQINSAISALMSRGLLHKPQVGYMALQNDGRLSVPPPKGVLRREMLMMRAERSLGTDDCYPIFEALVANRQLWLKRSDLAAKANYTHKSSKFPALIARMKKMDFVEFGPAGTVRLESKLMKFILDLEP